MHLIDRQTLLAVIHYCSLFGFVGRFHVRPGAFVFDVLSFVVCVESWLFSREGSV